MNSTSNVLTPTQAARELPKLASLIILYQRTFDDIRRLWKESDIQTLRLRMEENFPAASLLPIWGQLYAASKGPVQNDVVDKVDESLRRASEALKTIVQEGTRIEPDQEVIGNISPLIDKYMNLRQLVGHVAGNIRS